MRKRDAGLVVLDGFDVRLDFLAPEFVRRAGDACAPRSDPPA